MGLALLVHFRTWLLRNEPLAHFVPYIMQLFKCSKSQSYNGLFIARAREVSSAQHISSVKSALQANLRGLEMDCFCLFWLTTPDLLALPVLLEHFLQTATTTTFFTETTYFFTVTTYFLQLPATFHSHHLFDLKPGFPIPRQLCTVHKEPTSEGWRNITLLLLNHRTWVSPTGIAHSMLHLQKHFSDLAPPAMYQTLPMQWSFLTSWSVNQCFFALVVSLINVTYYPIFKRTVVFCHLIYLACILIYSNIAKGTTDPRVEFILPK